MIAESAESWVSIDAVAKHLDVKKDTIYRWLSKNLIPAHKVSKLWKFKLSEIDEWVRSGGAAEKGKKKPRRPRASN